MPDAHRLADDHDMREVQDKDRREALRRLLAMTLKRSSSVCVLSGLAACDSERRATASAADRVQLDHGFYIWQRLWRPALLQSMQVVQTQVAQWRVLAIHVDGQITHVSRIDMAALRGTHKPVQLVVRVEGSQLGFLNDALIDRIKAVHAQWIEQGLPPAGIELDHDVAERHLSAYAAWLRRLRAALAGVPLSITALPAWLHSTALPDLLRVPDEVVLQVHAVNSHAKKLFDAERAKDWIRAWAKQHAGPFRVALPCYGSRLAFDEGGRVLAIESEVDVPVRSGEERELLASATEVAHLLRWLDVQAPAQLHGVMWFRLPTAQDQRAWRLSTWQALVSGVRSWAPIRAQLSPTTDSHLWDISLINPSMVDQDLPFAVSLPEGVRIFDGEQGYVTDLLASRPRLIRRTAAWLRPHETLHIGWLRCAQAPASKGLDIHAS